MENKNKPDAKSVRLNDLLSGIIDKWEKQIALWERNELLKKSMIHPSELDIRIAQLRSCIYDLKNVCLKRG